MVSNHDKLRTIAHFPYQFGETSNIRFVERRIDFVEDAKWARLILEDANE